MDDGYKSKNGFYLCTESYTLADNLRLSEILKQKFSLECGIHKHTNGHMRVASIFLANLRINC